MTPPRRHKDHQDACADLAKSSLMSNVVLSQVVGFVIFTLMYKYLAGTPRALYTKWANLSAISWGSTLPVYTNIAVIGEPP